MSPAQRTIRNAIAVAVLMPVGMIVLPAWCLYGMARFLWTSLDEGWEELQK